MKHYLAIDIGGTNTKYSLADSSGVFFDKNEISTGTTSDELVNTLVNLINAYKESSNIAGVAICIPGFVDLKGNVIRVNAISGFVNYPLKERLESLTGVSTEIENDANCVALAENSRVMLLILMILLL